MRGVISQMLGIVILMVLVLTVFFISKFLVAGGYSNSLTLLANRHETEAFKGGVNAILYTTEEKTGKSLYELIGIAATLGNYTIDFGGDIGVVDVKKEIEKRFNAVYGRGHWYLRIPFPNDTATIQIVAVLDTSGSMCSQIKQVIFDVPKVIERLRKEGKNAEMAVYELGDPSCCYKDEDGVVKPLDLGKMKETPYFYVFDSSHMENCQRTGSTDEDWGNGLKCAIEKGICKPGGKCGWKKYALKIAIPISDELPGGCENGEEKARARFEKGLEAALKKKVIVFPFRGSSCGEYRFYYDYVDHRCIKREMRSFYCTCSRTSVIKFMKEIANKTGGEMIDLEYAPDVADKIEEILRNISAPRLPRLEAGSYPPLFKNVRGVQFIMPVVETGSFVRLEIKYWS